MILEDLLTAVGDLGLEHLLVVSQQELEPVALPVGLNIDAQVLVNRLVLALNEGVEVFGPVAELEFLFEGLEELVDLRHGQPDDAQDHKVEQRQLDN